MSLQAHFYLILDTKYQILYTSLMDSKTIIFIGRSGCGKGTQAKLLIEKLKAESPEKGVFYMESGERFREFISGSSYTAKESKRIMDEGGLQPAFLAVHIWSHLMIEQMDEGKHIIIDGTPRLLNEAMVLDSAFKFYGRENPTVIFLDTGIDWSYKRLEERGRLDDKRKGDIEKRFAWFEESVMPVIEFYKTNPNYNFIQINGEQSIEEVNKEIISKL